MIKLCDTVYFVFGQEPIFEHILGKGGMYAAMRELLNGTKYYTHICDFAFEVAIFATEGR